MQGTAISGSGRKCSSTTKLFNDVTSSFVWHSLTGKWTARKTRRVSTEQQGGCHLRRTHAQEGRRASPGEVSKQGPKRECWTANLRRPAGLPPEPLPPPPLLVVVDFVGRHFQFHYLLSLSLSPPHLQLTFLPTGDCVIKLSLIGQSRPLFSLYFVFSSNNAISAKNKREKYSSR